MTLIQMRRSKTSGSAPPSVADGELVLNQADSILYTPDAAGGIVATLLKGIAYLASPIFTGNPKAPTQAAHDNSTNIATTAYADGAAGAALTTAEGYTDTSVANLKSALATRKAVADAAYSILTTDRTVAVTSLTASRVLTLPSAATFPTGVQLTIVDESGACSASKTITVARAGSDTINGNASYVLGAARAYLALESNGSSAWTLVDASIIDASNLGSNAPAMNGSAAAGTSPQAAHADHVHPVDTSRQAALGFPPVQQGTGVGQSSNAVKLGWSGSALKYTIDSSDMGNLWGDNIGTKSLAGNGYQRLPSGLIIQWGSTGSLSGSGDVTITMPISFPNAALSLVVTPDAAPPSNQVIAYTTYNFGVSQFTVAPRYIQYASGSSYANQNARWIAIGW
jgi:hypothetical protein